MLARNSGHIYWHVTRDRDPCLSAQLHSGWELELILAQNPGQTRMQDSGSAASSEPQVTTALLFSIGMGRELLPIILTYPQLYTS